MELGEWIGGRIIENNSANRGSDNRGSTVLVFLVCTVRSGIKLYHTTDTVFAL